MSWVCEISSLRAASLCSLFHTPTLNFGGRGNCKHYLKHFNTNMFYLRTFVRQQSSHNSLAWTAATHCTRHEHKNVRECTHGNVKGTMINEWKPHACIYFIHSALYHATCLGRRDSLQPSAARRWGVCSVPCGIILQYKRCETTCALWEIGLAAGHWEWVRPIADLESLIHCLALHRPLSPWTMAHLHLRHRCVEHGGLVAEWYIGTAWHTDANLLPNKQAQQIKPIQRLRLVFEVLP